MIPLTIRNFRAWGASMEVSLGDQTREAQLLGSLLAVDIMLGMISVAAWTTTDGTTVSKISSLMSHPHVLAYAWLGLAVCITPYFVMQCFGVMHRWRRKITRLACRAILASGVLLAYLAYLSKHLDVKNVTWVLVMHSIVCVFMSAILALSINTAQGREQQRKDANDAV